MITGLYPSEGGGLQEFSRVKSSSLKDSNQCRRYKEREDEPVLRVLETLPYTDPSLKPKGIF